MATVALLGVLITNLLDAPASGSLEVSVLKRPGAAATKGNAKEVPLSSGSRVMAEETQDSV